jgi:energy-coupling factor transport system substrate-specific component
MCLAAIGAGLASFIWGYFRSGFMLLSIWILAVMLIIRLLSSLFFAGFLTYALANGFVKSGLLKTQHFEKISLGEDK